MRSAPGIPTRHDALRIEHDEGVIGDAGDEGAELPLALAQGLGGTLFGGDVTAGDVDLAVIGRHGPGNPAPGAVAMAEAVLHAHRHDALRQAGAAGDRCRRIVGMAQLAHMHGLDFVLAPAEQTAPGRIDAGEVAVEVGDAKQVFRHLPNAVAFARALLHFRFKPLGQRAQRAFVAHPLCRLERGDEQAADTVRRRWIGNGTIADGEMRLFRDATARHGPRMIDGEEFLAFAAQDGHAYGTKLVPDFRPDLARGAAERVRMFVAEDVDIGVVVNHHEVGAPAQRHRVAAREHDLDRPVQAG